MIEISPGAFVHLEPRECLTPDSLKHPTPFYT
ncbi:Integrase core domain protein [Escherichia coli P12b]|nr:Integrase core domain protein [Escherichia coli P12b]